MSQDIMKEKKYKTIKRNNNISFITKYLGYRLSSSMVIIKQK